MKFYLSLFILFFTSTFHLLFAQAPPIQWQKNYGGFGAEYAKCIQSTADGGYIIVGSSSSNNGDVSGGHGGADYWVVKISAAGNLIWQKCFGGSGEDIANSVHQTTDGGYIIAGTTTSTDGDVTNYHPGFQRGAITTDYWIIKISDTGILQWQKCYGGSGKEIANSVQQTTDGGYIVAGEANSTDGDVIGMHYNSTVGQQDAGDFWVLKLTTDGSIEWQKTYGTIYYERAYSVKQTPDGGYVVAGTEDSWDIGDVKGSHNRVGSLNDDYWILKLDANGLLQWQKCLGGFFPDVCYSLTLTSDGGYAVVGYTLSTDGDVTGHISGFYNLWVAKISSTGSLQWQKCYGGGNADEGRDIQQTSDGGYIIVGDANSTNRDVVGNHGNGDMWLLKLDDKGILQWQKCLGGTQNENGASVKQTSDGGYVVLGYSNSIDGDITNPKGYYDYWVVRFGPAPCVASISISASATNICSGSQVTFNASVINGGNNPIYQWKINGNNAGTNSNNFTTTTLNNNDTVSCILTSDAYCAATLVVASNKIIATVTSVVQPAITINAATTTICSGTAITFTATSTNVGNNPVYQWTKNGKNVGSNNSTYSDNTLNNADTIKCLLTSNKLCATPAIATSNDIIITVNPIVNPSVSITSSANNICPGTAVTFTATVFNGGSSPSYQWKKNGINVGANSPTLSYTSIANGDVFSCIINSNAICSSSPAASSNNIVISVQSLPGKVSLGNDTTICSGNNITLKASPGFVSYLWQNGSTGSSVIITLPGIYSVTATDACGNASSDTINAFVFPLVSNFLPKDTAICSNATLVLKPITSFKNYLWNNNSTSSFININSPGLYWLQVIDNNNCTSRDSIIISPKACFEAVNIPNTFTPNNDGINDTWVIKNLENYSSCTVQVFNRNGQLIFESKGYPKPWDGAMNGRSLPFGTYYYIIEAGTGLKPLTGYVTLLK